MLARQAGRIGKRYGWLSTLAGQATFNPSSTVSRILF
jgi:hypothetical protein